MYTPLRLMIFVFLALMFIFTTESYSATEAGRILTVKKNVYLIREGQRNTAMPETGLLLRDTVETDVKSRAKLFFMDDSILNLGELSRVVVEEYLYSPEKKRSKSIYRLIDGSLKVVVGRSDLEIHTPTAVAAARGTRFILWVEGSGEAMVTGILVLDGAVMVKNIVKGIEGAIIIGKGQMCRIFRGKPPSGVSPFGHTILKGFDEGTTVLGQVHEGRSSEGPPQLPDKHFKVHKDSSHSKMDQKDLHGPKDVPIIKGPKDKDKKPKKPPK